MRFLFSLFSEVIALIFLGIFLLIGFYMCTHCDHEETRYVYIFQTNSTTGNSYYRTVCSDCDEIRKTTMFNGNPTNTAYLPVMAAHCGTSEMAPEEYYTVTATVSDSHSAYDKLRLRCYVEGETATVYFTATFPEEFLEDLQALEGKDTVTFYGKYYTQGCGFTDCILITE